MNLIDLNVPPGWSATANAHGIDLVAKPYPGEVYYVRGEPGARGAADAWTWSWSIERGGWEIASGTAATSDDAIDAIIEVVASGYWWLTPSGSWVKTVSGGRKHKITQDPYTHDLFALRTAEAGGVFPEDAFYFSSLAEAKSYADASPGALPAPEPDGDDTALAALYEHSLYERTLALGGTWGKAPSIRAAEDAAAVARAHGQAFVASQQAVREWINSQLFKLDDPLDEPPADVWIDGKPYRLGGTIHPGEPVSRFVHEFTVPAGAYVLPADPGRSGFTQVKTSREYSSDALKAIADVLRRGHYHECYALGVDLAGTPFRYELAGLLIGALQGVAEWTAPKGSKIRDLIKEVRKLKVVKL